MPYRNKILTMVADGTCITLVVIDINKHEDKGFVRDIQMQGFSAFLGFANLREYGCARFQN